MSTNRKSPDANGKIGLSDIRFPFRFMRFKGRPQGWKASAPLSSRPNSGPMTFAVCSNSPKRKIFVERRIRYDTSKPGDDPGNAFFSVKLAHLAYKPPSELETELLSLGYTSPNFFYFATKLSSGFITEWDDVIAVAFKGSSNLAEWVNNFKIWREFTPYGGIHAGYFQTIEEIGPHIVQIILPGLLSGSKPVITGHSRGGSLATLFAALLMLNGHRVHVLHTFGAPKVGDRAFVDFFWGG